MKEKGYGYYISSAGSRFALEREGLLEEYEKLNISKEEELEWNRRLLADCRKKREQVSGRELTTTFYVPARTAGNSGDIRLMLANAGDTAKLFEDVVIKGIRQEDTYTLMLTAEYTLNVCAEKFREKFPGPVRRTGEILLLLLEMLEEGPVTVGKEYLEKPSYADKLTEEKLRKRMEDDKWAVRKYLLGEENR